MRANRRAKIWVVALAVGLGCAAMPAPRASLHEPGALLFNGYANPTADCFRCHGPDARGTARGPDLAAASRKLSPRMLETILREGSGRMPEYGSKLSDGDIAALVAWIRAQGAPKGASDRALEGQR